jgi:hypothetical protein
MFKPLSEMAASPEKRPTTYVCEMPAPNENAHDVNEAVQGATPAASELEAKDAQQISEAPTSRLRVAFMPSIAGALSSFWDEPARINSK